jgi:hypothetical protein
MNELSKDALTDLLNVSYKAMSDPNCIVVDNISKETSEELISIASTMFHKHMKVPEPKKDIVTTLNNYLETTYNSKLDWNKIADYVATGKVDPVLEERFLELFTSGL